MTSAKISCTPRVGEPCAKLAEGQKEETEKEKMKKEEEEKEGGTEEGEEEDEGEGGRNRGKGRNRWQGQPNILIQDSARREGKTSRERGRNR